MAQTNNHNNKTDLSNHLQDLDIEVKNLTPVTHSTMCRGVAPRGVPPLNPRIQHVITMKIARTCVTPLVTVLKILTPLLPPGPSNMDVIMIKQTVHTERECKNASKHVIVQYKYVLITINSWIPGDDERYEKLILQIVFSVRYKIDQIMCIF